jgi:hypothetical protein
MMATEVTIQRRAWDPLHMNSALHSGDAGVNKAEVRATAVESWAELVHYPIAFIWTIPPFAVRALKEAIPIGLVRNEPSTLHGGEFTDMAYILRGAAHDNAFPPHGWFVRFGQMSPKDGMYGSVPLTSWRQIVHQLATSSRALACLNDGETKLYLCHWDPTWCAGWELRAFVYNGRLTALSQYSASTTELPACTDEQLHRIAERAEAMVALLAPSFESAMQTRHVVCDLVWKPEDGVVRVVEFNPFGAHNPTGSAFFHWIEDEAILKAEKGLVFRVGSLPPLIV